MDVVVCQSCQFLRRARPSIFNKLSKRSLHTDGTTKLSYPPNSRFYCHTPTPSLTRRNCLRQSSQIWPNDSAQSSAGLFPAPCKKFNVMGATSLLHGTHRSIHLLSEKSFLTESEIEDVIHFSETPYKKGHAGYLTRCKNCSIDTGNEHHDKFTVFIDMRTGDSICRSCGVRYDWRTFRATMTHCDIASNVTLSPIVFKFDEHNPLEHTQWMNSEMIDENSKLELSTYFPLRRISPSMLQKFQVRYSGEGTLLFPYYDITGQCVIGFKIFDSTSEPVFVKDGEHLGLFGWHLIKPEHTRVVLTGNELDSIAITMATGLPSLSLPLGVTTLPPDCLPFLEQFNEVMLWFGDEYSAKENLQHFATKLNLARCSRVTSSTGASLILNEIGGNEVEQCIRNRRGLKHNDIISSKDLRSELYGALVNAKENAGVPFKRFPILNDYLKGHRRGELTIFTGPTGSGKTTFLSELSLDLCMQGVKTLWGSFEIRNVRLANIMIHQMSGLALEDHLEQFSHWSEELEKLPMYFMNYYGAQRTKTVLDTIEYAIYSYDVEHIIIDNMQFMVNINSGDNTFRVMDNAIASFRKCASKHNVHITLVIHPRKEDEGMLLRTSSVYGSAKATQEADNVFILQSLEETSMQITKNRFSGTTGIIPLLFNPSSLCMSGFHRIAETNVAVLPALKPKKLIRNLNVVRKKKR